MVIRIIWFKEHLNFKKKVKDQILAKFAFAKW